MGQFSDGLWYRATVEKIVNGQAHILYHQLVKWFHPQNWQQFHLGYPLRAENTILHVSSHPLMRTSIRKHMLFSTTKLWTN